MSLRQAAERASVPIDWNAIEEAFGESTRGVTLYLRSFHRAFRRWTGRTPAAYRGAVGG